MTPFSPWVVVALTGFAALGLSIIVLNRWLEKATTFMLGFIITAALLSMIYTWVGVQHPSVTQISVIVRTFIIVSFSIVDTLVLQVLYEHWRKHDRRN